MSITRWDPFRDMIALREAMNRLFDESFVRPGTRWTESVGEGACALPIDVYTTDEDLVVTVAVPGMDPGAVDITIEGDTLTIKGELVGPLDNVDYLVHERTYGKFNRALRLNIPVQADKAEATFDKGVLTLVVPKQEEVKPRTIKVKAKKSA